jgi:hypothetical protein
LIRSSLFLIRMRSFNMGRPKSVENLRKYTFSLTDEHIEMIRFCAHERKMKMSSLIKKLIEDLYKGMK